MFVYDQQGMWMRLLQTGKIFSKRKISAQVIVETLAAFMLIFMLFIGTTKLFLFMVKNMAHRQAAWEQSRIIRAEQANLNPDPDVNTWTITPDDVRPVGYEANDELQLVD